MSFISVLPPAWAGKLTLTRAEDAWHVVSTIDPLVESDEENADEHVRRDYSKFIHINVQYKILTFLSNSSKVEDT